MISTEPGSLELWDGNATNTICACWEELPHGEPLWELHTFKCLFSVCIHTVIGTLKWHKVHHNHIVFPPSYTGSIKSGLHCASIYPCFFKFTSDDFFPMILVISTNMPYIALRAASLTTRRAHNSSFFFVFLHFYHVALSAAHKYFCINQALIANSFIISR